MDFFLQLYRARASFIIQIPPRVSTVSLFFPSETFITYIYFQHDLEKLHHLTKKWRHACQAVLNELLAEYRARDESCSMMTLLRSLGIPASLVRYNETDMEFHDE